MYCNSSALRSCGCLASTRPSHAHIAHYLQRRRHWKIHKLFCKEYAKAAETTLVIRGGGDGGIACSTELRGHRVEKSFVARPYFLLAAVRRAFY